MDQDVWLTASEVAKRLGVSRSTVWRTPPAELPYVMTTGKQRRYRESDVLAALGESTHEARISSLEDRVTRLESERG